MNLDLAFVDGQLRPANAAAISPMDAGFQQGIGIYETIRVLRGRPLFLREHLERMESSRIAMRLAPPRWEVADSIRRLLAQAGDGEAALRATLTAGAGAGSTLALTLRPIPAVPQPLRVWISSYRKMRGDLVEAIKTTSRARNALAREEAAAHGAFEAILPTNEGDLAEGSVSNFYLVRQGVLVTPPLDSGCLPGVTRGKVLQLARELGISIREMAIFPQDLSGAQEMLISNALIGIHAVDEVVGVFRFPAGQAGALFPRLRKAYEQLIENHLRLPPEGAELQ